jgi:hypothetical protein
VEYPEPDEDEPSRDVLLPEQKRHETAIPGSPPLQKAALFCPLSGQVCHLKSWLTQYFADHVDIFHLYAEMGDDEQTEMQLKFQDLRNLSAFVTIPKVDVTGQCLTAASGVVITQKFWVLNEQQRAFARVVQLELNRAPYTWLLNTGPGGYDNRLNDLHQLSGVAEMNALHSLWSRPNITT